MTLKGLEHLTVENYKYCKIALLIARFAQDWPFESLQNKEEMDGLHFGVLVNTLPFKPQKHRVCSIGNR
jgi:hypothetical protein